MVFKKQGRREPPERRVLRFIREHSLVEGKRRLLVAVSGGPDSVCLLHILAGIHKELGIDLYVAHLNHCLRGRESEADARYVSRLAERLGIPCTIEERDVEAYRTLHRYSLEEAAREVRYTFLAELAETTGADSVAVGHTSDDNIETILMHLIRGTGTRGLRGLQPKTLWRLDDKSIEVIRPLLVMSRQETNDYCHQNKLEPRTDATNLSLSPLRNRIRHQLLPVLESLNERIADVLLRTARIAGDELDFLDIESSRLWDSIAQRQGKTIILDKEGFLVLPPALQRHLLRKAIEDISGSLRDIETRHIEDILAALNKPAGKKLSLPGGIAFIIEYDRYMLTMESLALSPFSPLGGEIDLEIPGETAFSGWRVSASVITREQMEPGDSDFTAYLSLDEVGDKLVVRPRQTGDRFQPLGMDQPKKLGEYMIDAKIPRAWRDRVPLVCSPEHIAWIVGWRIDDRSKVTGDTKRVLRLEFKNVSRT